MLDHFTAWQQRLVRSKCTFKNLCKMGLRRASTQHSEN